MRALLVQSPATSPWVPRQQWEPPSIALATIAGQIEQMRHFTNLNDFGREIQGRSGGDSYHPSSALRRTRLPIPACRF